MGRSVSEQVSHWARLGRELERSPGVSVARVHAVLAGERSYDDLNSSEQAFVRSAWDEQIADRLANLDLAAHFEAQGHSWAEIAADGSLRIVEPAKSR